MSEMSHTDADSDAGLPDDSDEADDEIEVLDTSINFILPLLYMILICSYEITFII